MMVSTKYLNASPGLG